MFVDTNLARTVTTSNKVKVNNSSEVGETSGSFASFLEEKQTEKFAGYDEDATIKDIKSMRISDPEGLLRENRSIEYFDRIKAFDKLDVEDAKVFREIFADNIISDEEVNNLSFEQIQKLDKFIYDGKNIFAEFRGYFTYEDKAKGILEVSRSTADNRLNQSLINTVKQMNKEQLDHIRDFILELKKNLNQVIAGIPPHPNYMLVEGEEKVKMTIFRNEESFNGLDINIKDFLNTYIPQLLNMVEESRSTGLSNKIYKEQQNYINIYENLRDNYNKLV